MAAADRNLLFGLLALQNGLIDQVQLVGGFQAWTRDKSRSLAEHLEALGGLTSAKRALLEQLALAHLEAHGGSIENSLAAISEGPSARENLTTIRESQNDETLAHVASTLNGQEPFDQPATLSIGAATSEGQRFRILRAHARGGLGEVFVALDSELNREVAVKQIHDRHADDEASRQRFVIEAEITGGLEHPGIVPVYGLGSYRDGRPYYAMRFIRGENLKEAIGAFHADASLKNNPGRKSLELRKILRRFTDVCNAIEYAHSRGVLHRDIKPSNVILGKHGETLVVDWGLAKAVGKVDPGISSGEGTFIPGSASNSAETLPGSALGTPGYMSPEQAAGDLQTLGPHSDVYSLGATLYCVLTGKAPIEGCDVGEMLRKAQKGSIRPPRSIDPSIDKALEAVCLKAMANAREDRYSSSRALADDVERWMADEPVLAWNEPRWRRLRRWAKRHRTLVTSTSVAMILVLAVLGYLGYEERLRQGRRLTAALARVDALGTAQTQALPIIVRQLAPDVELVRDRLERMAAGNGSNRDSRRLPAALALVGVDPGQAGFLTTFILSGEPGPAEVLVVRAALEEGGPKDGIDPIRKLLETTPAEVSDVQLRAAGMLAVLDHATAARNELAAPLARKLVTENPLLLGTWSEVFQPVSRGLIKPLLALFADTSRPEPRDRAFRLLLEFVDRPDNASRAEDLAALLADADPDRAHLVIERLNGPTERARAVAALAPLLEDIARFDAAKAARQGRIATALMLLGEEARVWPLFAQSDDPSVRTELVHNLAAYGVDISKVVGRLKTEPDASARRALLLSLGGFPPRKLHDSDREALTTNLLSRYRTDPDPGVHAAINWLLRTRWGFESEVETADHESASSHVPTERDWYVNSQGQTYSVIRGPATFRMGSTPRVVPDLLPSEPDHARHIPRSYAISSREVTMREFGRFLDTRTVGVTDNRADPLYRKLSPECAAAAMTWFEATRYCNWLSATEGLPKNQWCYPDNFGPGSNLPVDFLDRTGYRLPTEAEWEYACRAGTISAYPFGQGVAWLPNYAWFDKQSGMSMKRVAQLEPNDLGLFDILGNAYEWVSDPHEPYPTDPGGKPVVDVLRNLSCPEDLVRVIRGGAYPLASSSVRSGFRSFGLKPSFRYPYFGFRTARTLR